MRRVENYVLPDESDYLMFGTCHILNSSCWPDVTFGVAESELRPQISALCKVFFTFQI